MNLNEVFRKAGKAWYSKKNTKKSELGSVQKRSRYTKQYFEKIEEEKFGSITSAKKEKK